MSQSKTPKFDEELKKELNQLQLYTKTCANCGKEFKIEAEDIEFYKKIKVSAPDFCPTCRMENLLSFWPFGKFHIRKCDLTGKKIVSIFSSQSKFPVYDSKEWNSDNWESPQLDLDFSKSFFNQLKELQSKTPHPHQLGTNNVNCDYSDDVWNSKNCYLCRSLANCENLSYSYRTLGCRDSIDITYSFNLEKCYDCTYCFDSYKLKYSFNSKNCTDSSFLYDCHNCQNCFMCWNLRNKSYCILNKQYTKEEYEKKMAEYNMNSYNEVQKMKNDYAEILKKEAIHRENLNSKTENSLGNYLSECKNCRHTYFWETSENCSYSFRGLQSKDSFDSTGLFKCELCYGSMQIVDCYNVKYSMYSTNCRNSEYLDSCIDCENCFGCVGLKKKKYCILNKQYTKEEYEKNIKEIKKKLNEDKNTWRFFPLSMAFLGYNLSLAGIYFPNKTKEEVEKEGGYWEKLEERQSQDREIIDFIDDIRNVNEDILNKGFKCEKTGRLFNVTKNELQFYRDNNIPLPHLYPDERTKQRILEMTGPFTRKEKCYFCQKDITTYYPKEWGYKKIACQKCYRKEVI